MYDLIFSCQSESKYVLILLVDFVKAYDSLSWSFIDEALKQFNFVLRGKLDQMDKPLLRLLQHTYHVK